MASRKSTKKKTTRRHRRVGALSMRGNAQLFKIAAIAAGYFLGDKLNDFITNATGGKIDGKIVAGAEVGLGALLLMSKGRQTMMKTVIGGLSLGAGLKKALKEFGVISGYGNVPVLGARRPMRRVAGYGDVPVIGGYDSPGTLAGYDSPGTLAGNRQRVMAGMNSSGSGLM